MVRIHDRPLRAEVRLRLRRSHDDFCALFFTKPRLCVGTGKARTGYDSMSDLRPLDVVLDSQEESLILGQLGQHSLRGVIELVVSLELGQERLQTVFLRQPSHPQEQVPGGVVLRDRLQ